MSDPPSTPEQIGGPVCRDELEQPGLIPSTGQALTPHELDALWEIFQAIGHQWKDLFHKATDSANLKSSWLDFIKAKTESEPSYIGEYSNAVLCVSELIDEENGDKKEAFRKLFLENNIESSIERGVIYYTEPMTRLAHAKRYVIDEFIRVNVVASGFKSFGAPENRARNYKGYLGGSRYNLKARVREYVPPTKAPKAKAKAKAPKAK